MGSSPIVGGPGSLGGGGGGGGGSGGGGCGGGSNGSSGSCCHMSLKCWCRWEQKQQQRWWWWLFSSGFVFFLGCFVLFGSFATLYAWFAFTPSVRTGLTSSLGCQQDNEGSWSVGVFYGDSPFSLKPIESVSPFFFFNMGILFLNNFEKKK